MKKNILLSMMIVFLSTFFLLIFFSGGLFVLDKLARANNTVEAKSDHPIERLSKEHSFITNKTRLKETEIGLVVNRSDKQKEITIAFAGDVMMQGSIERAMNKYGIDYPFLQVKDELQEVDYAIVNLETAVTNRGTAYDKQFHFRTGPDSLIALQNSGFNMVSLANNHTMDYGEEGLVDTIDFLNEVGLAYVGAGRNSKEAYAPYIIDIKGQQVAILGFSRVLPTVSWYAGASKPGVASGYQIDRMARIIDEVKQEVDFVFVFMHWGIERRQIPEPYQIQDARAMIDAGADGVVGTHPHVIQGLDYYKGKPIAYSIGNFLFPDYVHGLTAESGVLTMIIREDDIEMKFTPYEITGNQVAKVSDQVVEARLAALEELSFNVSREGNIFSSP